MTQRNSASTTEADGLRARRVRETLTAAFEPARLDILDESSRHAHHVTKPRGPEAGATETHFRVHLVSHVFAGVSRVNRSRMVHDALCYEFGSGLHALALTLRTPEEESALA
ncbi:BolA family protein [Acetobacter orleanensis]|uniref:Transcriptional regulator n=1 Tax=Acetobacter orleanensis TaxID=104099 RepID=A0A4Y3TIZ2_9PROT|nr:BolA family protein [Acetobacter orleanensis]KXV62023.1 BolA family transcriptional regulator [Acetobacter orleanensis]PCD80356.1 BolA family transcriptional regulator [Acetobacter orleanensis]GAN68888.1 stress response and cell division protein BolA [Acetobacter orleanensis JCM 7639]GBR30838.1 stress response and cell division protein BolA [Acetobacter orleanensis NRIC 0473]GEB81704.1 transcriptional regulator [Acetobacter orleanensis]